MKRLTFGVAGDPVPQGSGRPIVSKTTGKAFVKPSRSEALADWRGSIAVAARKAGAVPTGEPVELHAVFSLKRPKAHLSTKTGLRPSAPAEHTQRPDIDKLTRAVLDALTGVAYDDDSQVCRLDVTKEWAHRSGVRVAILTDFEPHHEHMGVLA